MIPCRDRGLENCKLPRCRVLAVCYADIREHAPQEDEEEHLRGCERYGYDPWPERTIWDGPTLYHIQRMVAEQVAARLIVAWLSYFLLAVCVDMFNHC